MGSNSCTSKKQQSEMYMIKNSEVMKYIEEQNGAENILETEDSFHVMHAKVLSIIFQPSPSGSKAELEYQQQIEENTSEKGEQTLSTFNRQQLKLKEMKTFEWLQEWMKMLQQEARELGSRKTGTKQTIQSYQNFLTSFLPKYKDIAIHDEDFFKIRKQPITDYYVLNNKIGQGSFGSVYEGFDIKTGEKRAIKIMKRNFMKEKDLQNFQNQINMLRKMDHINIIKIYDIFSFKGFYYVVTEYCSGGTLMDAFQNHQLRDVKVIKIVMKQLFSAVYYMHKKKIMHRDIKLDNIVLVSEIQVFTSQTDTVSFQQNVCIKLIDFGLATMPNDMFSNKCGHVGTSSYMAPQILKGSFCYQSDIWSCGIILCILLVGYNPFKDKTKQLTMHNILNKNIDFKKDENYCNIPDSGRHLLSKILCKVPFKRLSCEKILQHQFLQKTMEGAYCKREEIERKTLVVRNIENFKRGSNFTNFIKNFLICKKVSQTHRQQMAMIFEKIDTDGSGVIQKQELEQLYRVVTGLSPEQLSTYLSQIDQNKSSKIDFHQFLVLMTNNDCLNNNSYLCQAFSFIDCDKTGYIEKNQILNCLVGCDEDQILSLVKQMDFNNDGKISFDQFCRYMIEFA